MKFSDLFLPKIARSNPKVRIDAVRSETNLGLLKKVLENDEDADVREAARMRIQALETTETA